MRNINLFFLSIILMGLAGCTTTNQLSWEDQTLIKHSKEMAGKTFRDSYGGYTLTYENNDLYLAHGDTKARITNTPDVVETYAFVTKDLKSIVYRTTDSQFLKEKYFIQPIDKDDGSRLEFTDSDYTTYHQERFPEVYKF